jgi:hypothetical protein
MPGAGLQGNTGVHRSPTPFSLNVALAHTSTWTPPPPLLEGCPPPLRMSTKSTFTAGMRDG